MLNGSKMMKRYPLVLIVTLAVIAYGVMRLYLNVDVFESLRGFLVRHERTEIYAMIVFSLMAALALAVDQTRNVRRQRIKNALHKGRISAVRSTMATVHDIVNNALNNLLLIRFEAEKSKALSPETLSLFEDLIEDTALQLREIDALEMLSERTLAPGLVRLELDREKRLAAA